MQYAIQIKQRPSIVPSMGRIAAGDARLSREEIISIPLRSAARLVGVSEQRLLNWSRIHLLSPHVRRQISERNTVRLYSFSDVLSLLVVRELLNQKLTTPQINRVIKFLQDEGHERPLTTFKFAVLGNEIFFQYPDGLWQGSKRASQIVIHQVLDLRPLREEIYQSIDKPRSPDAQGKIERRRKVQGSKRVFEDTRVPVDAVIRYINNGTPESTILKVFPSLSKADIRLAKAEAKLAAV